MDQAREERDEGEGEDDDPFGATPSLTQAEADPEEQERAKAEYDAVAREACQEADHQDDDRQLDIDDSVYCLTFTCMIEKVRLKFEFDPYLEDYFFKSTMVFFI